MAVTSLAKTQDFVAGGGGHIIGPFGTGQRQMFKTSGDFVAPKDGLYRVRMWGGMGSSSSYSNNYYRGGGGAFVLKVVELKKGQIVPVTVGTSASFGVFCSAGRGSNSDAVNSVYGYGGTAVGGDINLTGRTGPKATSSWPSAPSPIGLKDYFSQFNNVDRINAYVNDIDYLEVNASLGSTSIGFLIVEY